MGQLRVKEGAELERTLEAMVRVAEKAARPKLCYRVAYVESKRDKHLIIEGIQSTSRVSWGSFGMKRSSFWPFEGTDSIFKNT